MNWVKRFIYLLRRFFRKSSGSKTSKNISTIQMANAQLLPHVVQLLSEGHTVTLPLRGNSMRPFLRDGRDKALLERLDGKPEVGDAVLAEVKPKIYMLHRIVAIDSEGNVTMRGDGNLHAEHCHLRDIRARAKGFYRKGREKPDMTDGRKWRIYSWWWTRLLPIRRYLLFILYPHFPARMLR